MRRDLARACGRANEEEVGDINAGDEKDEHSRTEEGKNCGTCVAQEFIAKRSERGAGGAVAFGVFLSQAGGDIVHLGASFRDNLTKRRARFLVGQQVAPQKRTNPEH
jgi:hypothetical protein